MAIADYKEIIKLKEMLEKANIPFDFFRFLDGDEYFPKSYLDMMDGYVLKYPNRGSGEVCSVIEHGGSYGHEADKLEIMGLTGTDDVEGWLSAEEVFNRIKKHYESEEK